MKRADVQLYICTNTIEEGQDLRARKRGFDMRADFISRKNYTSFGRKVRERR